MGKIHSIALSLFIIFAVFFTPILLGLLIALAVSIQRPKYAKLLPMFFLLLFIILNLARQPSGDYIWYSKHYVWLSDGNIFDYFGVPLYGVSAKITEPIYHIYAKLLSFLSSGNLILYVVMTTFVIYAIFGSAIKKVELYI